MEKKMKHLLTLALFLVAAMGYAQNPTSNTGANTATVNIILLDFQSVVVSQADNQIDLVYDTQQAYQDGVSVSKANHVKVFSTKDYDLQSAVWQENLLTQHDISINGVLQTRQFQTFHQGSKGETLFDVDYSAKGNNEYLDKNKTTYTTQVIYQIQPR